MNTETKRIDWIDYAKLFAILLVVIGHSFRDEMRQASYTCEFIYKFIYRFHMPMWFMLSGILYGYHRDRYTAKSGISFILGKIKTLLIPFTVYSLLIFAAFKAAGAVPQLAARLSGSEYGTMNIGAYIRRSVLLADNPYAFHLWYLEVLFILSAAVYALDKTMKKKTADLCLEAGMIGIMLVRVVIDSTPFIDHSRNWLGVAMLRDTPWYIGGILLSGKTGIFTSDSYAAIKNTALIPAVIFMTLRITLFVDALKNPAARIIIQTVEYASAFTIIVSLIRFSSFLCRRLNGRFSYIGQKSYTIYLLHQPLCAFLGMIAYSTLHLPAPAVIVLCIAASLIAPLLVIKIINVLHINKIFKAALNID